MNTLKKIPAKKTMTVNEVAILLQVYQGKGPIVYFSKDYNEKDSLEERNLIRQNGLLQTIEITKLGLALVYKIMSNL